MSSSHNHIGRKETIAHFLHHGFYEGIVPVPATTFDEEPYLLHHPDIEVAKATGEVASGYAHYVLAGRDEGRIPAQ